MLLIPTLHNPFEKLQSAIGQPMESDYVSQAVLIMDPIWASEYCDSRGKSDLKIVLEKIDELPICGLTKEMRALVEACL